MFGPLQEIQNIGMNLRFSNQKGSLTAQLIIEVGTLSICHLAQDGGYALEFRLLNQF